MADPRPFGDPPTVQALSEQLKQASTELDQLRQTLRRAAQGVYPDLWNGQAAQRFGADLQRQIDAVTRLGQITTTTQADTLSTLSMRLAEATFDFDNVQIYARANGLLITPELRVLPVDPSDPHAGALARTMQVEVDMIKANAESALRTAAGGNQQAIEQMLELTQLLLTLIPVEGEIAGILAGLRRLATARRDGTTSEKWERVEQDLRRRQQAVDQQTERMWREVENKRNPQFADELAAVHGPKPRNAVAHHNFPVEFSGKFQQLGIDTKNAAWGSWVDETSHVNFTPELRKDWASFWNSPQMQEATRVGADPATIQSGRDAAFDFARAMGHKYDYQVPF